jgi:hypothetical protein
MCLGCHSHRLGYHLQLLLSVPLRPHCPAMDHRTCGEMHGSDLVTKVPDRDQPSHRPCHCHTPNSVRVAVADAQDGKVCRIGMFWHGVGVCGNRHCAVHPHLHNRYVSRPVLSDTKKSTKINISIDLIGNLTGTSLTTFMLCTIELMLAGICTSLPMIRPFYLKLRSHYKKSSMSGSGRMNGLKRSNTDQGGLGGSGHPRPGQYTQWMELVSRLMKRSK